MKTILTALVLIALSRPAAAQFGGCSWVSLGNGQWTLVSETGPCQGKCTQQPGWFAPAGTLTGQACTAQPTIARRTRSNRSRYRLAFK